MKIPSPLVLITGASSGIGQALAQAYLQRGWRVALLARRTEALQQWLHSLPPEFSAGQTCILGATSAMQTAWSELHSIAWRPWGCRMW